MGKAITQKEYEKLLYDNNPELKLLSNFKGLASKVIIMDKFGIKYNVNSRSVLQNKSPHIKCAIDKTEAFNIKLKQVFPDLELQGTYIKGNLKGYIVDELGIIYYIKLESILRGSHPSILSAIDKTDAFIKKAKVVHGNKYNYSKSIYRGDKIKINIICNKHGIFEQQPNNHLKQKQGCPACNTARGWTKKEWLNYVENKKCIFYIIKCCNDSESFIKFGITSNSIKKRFQSKREMPYNYNIVLKLTGTGEDVWNLEKFYSECFKNQKYKPEIAFKGLRECYDIKIINQLKF